MVKKSTSDTRVDHPADSEYGRGQWFIAGHPCSASVSLRFGIGLLALLLAVGPLAATEQETTALMRDATEALQKGDLDSAKSLFQLVLVSDPRNQAARNFLRQITAKEAKSAVLVRSLEQIIIPQIDLKDVSAREAFDFTLAVTQKNAPNGFKPNMVWMVPPDHTARVTISLESIPANLALQYVAESAGLVLSYDEHAIRVRLPEEQPRPE